MNSYSHLQTSLLKETLLMEIVCKNSSYLRIGGYNARPYSLILNLKESIRTSKIKGYLRWWARVLFLGSHPNIKTYKGIEKEIIGKILGSESKDEGVSKIRIEVDYKIGENYNDFQKQIISFIDKYINALLNLIHDYFKSEFYLNYKVMIKISINPSDIYIQFYSKNDFSSLCEKLFNYINRYISDPSNKISEIFTLESENESKKFKCKFNKREKIYEYRIRLHFHDESDFSKIVNLPRIKLLLMERKKQGESDVIDGTLNEKNEKYINRIKEDLLFYPPGSINVNLKVYINNSILVKDDKLSYVIQVIQVIGTLTSIILTLILNGLSALSSRGFAGVKIDSIQINEDIFKGNEWDEFVKVVKNLVSAENEDELIKNIKLLLKVNKINEFSEIPKVPTITLEDRYFKITAIKIPINKDILDVLKIINESVLKISWKKTPKESGREYHTWLLGLPRSQRKTGYIVYDEMGKKVEGFRRKSSIGINVFESTKNVKFVVIHGFLSKDWPLYEFNKKYVLRWLSNGTPENVEDIMYKMYGHVSIDEILEKVFNDAFNNVGNYIYKELHEEK